MNYYYITGTSRGIGKAIALELLKSDKNFVFGISRTNTIEHKNYKHYNKDFNNICDLYDISLSELIDFDELQNPEKIVLINNSAVLGEIQQLGKKIDVELFRIPYPVEAVVNGLKKNNLPAIYMKMYRKGKKLN